MRLREKVCGDKNTELAVRNTQSGRERDDDDDDNYARGFQELQNSALFLSSP